MATVGTLFSANLEATLAFVAGITVVLCPFDWSCRGSLFALVLGLPRWMTDAFRAFRVLTRYAYLVMAKGCVAGMAGVPDSHPDRLLHALCGFGSPGLLGFPLAFVDLEVILLEEFPHPCQASVDIGLHRWLCRVSLFSPIASRGGCWGRL